MARLSGLLVLSMSVVALSCRDGSSNGGAPPGPPPLAITSASLPGATEGQDYSFSLQSSGGVAPLSWAVTGGALPTGMGLDSGTAEISGLPPAPPPSGQYPFTVTVTDGQSPAVSASKAFVLNVAPATFPPCSGNTTKGYPPLDDPAIQDYLGLYPTGLYDDTSTRPGGHDLAARRLQPLDMNGNPDPAGRYVFLSIGMSNTTLEFSSFMAQAALDPDVNAREMVIINGAAGGAAAGTWDQPTDPNYDRIRDNELAPRALDERHVQAAWVKVANPGPSLSLPDPGADALNLLGQLGDIVRALKVRYPNIRQVYLTCRIYAGFATTTLNPEPYAYESGFSVKWLILSQLDQMGGAGVDPVAGDLDYNTVAPWIAWGPYVWADGIDPRQSDGLYWTCTNFASDGTHPSLSGREKVANALLHFLKTDPVAREWFLANP